MRQIVLRMLAPIHIEVDEEAMEILATTNGISKESISQLSDDHLIDAVKEALKSDLNSLFIFDSINDSSFEISIATGRPGLGITQEK